ncbi:MAG: 50S ribosomal protein L35 [Candidatus Margulisiibacteriota bacterium]|jgi:large subunit ribosomal protein L35
MKKQKIKTKKAAAKRFKVTGSGRVTRRKAGKKHLLEHKSADRKRSLTGDFVVDPTEMKKIRRMLPGMSLKK